jgi:hypothetical protein
MHGKIQHQTGGIPSLRGNPHTATTSFEKLKETPDTQRFLKPGFAAAKGKITPFTQHGFILTSLYAYILL